MGSQRRRNKRAPRTPRRHPKNLRLDSIQGDERRPRDLERRQGLLARSTAANRYTWLRGQTKSKRRKGCTLETRLSPFLFFVANVSPSLYSSPLFHAGRLALLGFALQINPFADRVHLSSRYKLTLFDDRVLLQLCFLKPL